MHKGNTIGYALLVLLLFGSSGLLAETEKNRPALKPMEVERAIMLADTARKKATAVGGEWRDVRRMIGMARSAVWKDKLEYAMNLAKNAQKQAELGYEQAVKQKDFKMPSYLKE